VVFWGGGGLNMLGVRKDRVYFFDWGGERAFRGLGYLAEQEEVSTSESLSLACSDVCGERVGWVVSERREKKGWVNLPFERGG